MRDLDDKAGRARDKKAGLGPDIDLSTFESQSVSHRYLEDLKALSQQDRKQMILAGVEMSHEAAVGKIAREAFLN